VGVVTLQQVYQKAKADVILIPALMVVPGGISFNFIKHAVYLGNLALLKRNKTLVFKTI